MGKKLLEKNVTVSLFLFYSPPPSPFMAVALLRQGECGSSVPGTSTREEKEGAKDKKEEKEEEGQGREGGLQVLGQHGLWRVG